MWCAGPLRQQPALVVSWPADTMSLLMIVVGGSESQCWTTIGPRPMGYLCTLYRASLPAATCTETQSIVTTVCQAVARV